MDLLLIMMAIIAIVGGSTLLYSYVKERQRQKEQKGFIVIGTALLLGFILPGSTLTIIGIVLLLILLLRGCG